MARERYLVARESIRAKDRERHAKTAFELSRSNVHARFQREPVVALYQKRAPTKRPGIIGNFDPFVKRAPTSFDRVTASYFCKRACIVNLGEIPRAWYFFFFFLSSLRAWSWKEGAGKIEIIGLVV